MPAEYLVEIYASAGREQAKSAQEVRKAVGRAAEDDSSFRYVRTISLPEDEVCLHLVQAPTIEALGEVFRHAGIRVDRVAEATETTANGSARRREGR